MWMSDVEGHQQWHDGDTNSPGKVNLNTRKKNVRNEKSSISKAHLSRVFLM